MIEKKKLRVIYDLETSGFNPMPLLSDYHHILQIAALNLDTGETFISFVKPKYQNFSIPPQSTNIHKITDEDIADADDIYTVINKLASSFRFGDYDEIEFIAHNNDNFDKIVLLKFIHNKLDITKYTFWDTLQFLRWKYPEIDSYNLGALYKRFFRKDFENAHRADADVYALADIYRLKIKPFRLEDSVRPISIECITNIRFLGSYRARIFYENFNVCTVTQLKDFALSFLVRGERTGFDKVLRSVVGMSNATQRMFVISKVYDKEIWKVDELKAFLDREGDDDTIDAVDYCVKYKYFLKSSPPCKHLYYKGLYKIKYKIS